MAYDAELAERVRDLVGTEYGVAERRMFGGVAFLVNGNLAVAVSSHGGLMVRVPAEETATVMTEPHAHPMVMSGREVQGWVRVHPDGCDGETLVDWVDRGMEHARTLPPG